MSINPMINIHSRPQAQVEFFPVGLGIRGGLALDDEADSLIGHDSPFVYCTIHSEMSVAS
jgi:hypothetical protein